jgi:hypothetical protein
MLSVAPQSLAMEPVLGGISGSTRTMLNVWEAGIQFINIEVKRIQNEGIYLRKSRQTTKKLRSLNGWQKIALFMHSACKPLDVTTRSWISIRPRKKKIKQEMGD